MNTSTYADWSTWSTPLVELQKVNQETTEKVIRECISYCSDNAATGAKWSSTMPRVTSFEDFLTMQIRLANQQAEKGLEFAQNIFSIYQDAIKSNLQWTEQKVSSAMKTATSAANSAKGRRDEDTK